MVSNSYLLSERFIISSDALAYLKSSNRTNLQAHHINILKLYLNTIVIDFAAK